MKTMQVIAATPSGGPQVLHLAQRAIPSPGCAEVLIRARAAGLNHADPAQRTGYYPLPGTSDILGLEVAAEIMQVEPA